MDLIPTSLYIHIPFCASKCYYCDFNSYVSTSDVMDRYLDALDKELSLLANEYNWKPLRTVFFGGGTPTIFNAKQTERMLTILHRSFKLHEDAEVTVEANPGTVDLEKLRILREGGVNRLSFGVQSFDDQLLKRLGRLHDREQVYQSYEWARKAGFSSINLDLMFGLPGQTVELFHESLQRFLTLDPEHLSAYSLKIEEGTPFANWYDRGQLTLPPEEDEIEMYTLLREKTMQHGYEMYEISNFAKEGFACEHNQVYWRNEPYLAAGSGAHGYVEGTRYVIEKSVPDYIDKTLQGRRPVVESERINERIQQEDTMILGLRMREGVTYDRFRERHQIDMLTVFGEEIKKLQDAGLLEADHRGVRLTEQALLLANEVFAAFLDT
ncbi:coproporphyrinogen III oxidase [Collibacillus ludicampi]|uniref:Heme chaperone HemW n=1 Tax=Collibacillus ludicampi TaxID=2771369 RepID=A0AAV4LIW7_9BACL|nr:radical SAM family heme chaperone HemW [Collibacillus ludicampi]GIM47352.1 coproporphyrinogen III oxidase [Collibacillus ludicampi]